MNAKLILSCLLFTACAVADETGSTQQASEMTTASSSVQLETVQDGSSQCAPSEQVEPSCLAACNGDDNCAAKNCPCVPLYNPSAGEEVSQGEAEIPDGYSGANLVAALTARAPITYVKIIGPDHEIIGPDKEIIGPNHVLASFTLDGKLGYREHVARLRKELVQQTSLYGGVRIRMYMRH